VTVGSYNVYLNDIDIKGWNCKEIRQPISVTTIVMSSIAFTLITRGRGVAVSPVLL
jgi:hypothetical protein